MSANDDWDDLVGAPPQNEDDVLARAALEYQRAAEAVDIQRERMKEAASVLLASFEEDPGATKTAVAGNVTITVSWPEKWEWDEGKLKEIVGDDDEALPPFVSKSLKVNKKAFQNEPQTEQAKFLPALTTKPGTPKITIGKKES